MLLADSSLQFLPPLTPLALLGLLAVLLAAGLALGWLLGAANVVARRWSLWLLRGSILAVVIVVLLNPVRVDELAGPVERPEMFYLLDTSASMQIGSPRSRWDETLRRIEEAHKLAESSSVVVKPFRFGQRLMAIEHLDLIGLRTGSEIGVPRVTPAAAVSRDSSSDSASLRSALRPTDGDTRLLTALRQISSRFGRLPPQGIVIFSDGRARDDAPVAQLAQQFAKLKVPVHVVPVGDTSKGGDAAVAAVVLPPRVRKFTEVEVQVFVRSFGYDGKRSEVQLLEVEGGGRAGRTLASLPITLQSGFQSVSLTFRTEVSTRRLRVAIPTLADEVTERNNQIDAEIAIDRTKIRVLYIEGSAQGISRVATADRYQLRGPFTDLKQALVEDEDIECVVLTSRPGSGQLTRIAENSAVDGVRGFPSTVAELAAFDCLILSNVAKDAFTDKQLQWIEQWIGQRGGGLCMIGGENSFASGGWSETPLAAMLPVEMMPGQFDWLAGETVKIAPHLPQSPHALWRLLADDKQNREVVAALPAVTGINRWAGVRPSLTTVLATTSVSGLPVEAPQPQSALSFRSLSSALQPFVGGRPTPGRTVRTGTAVAGDVAEIPAIVAGRYGRGRTAALAIPITSPYADDLVQKWGAGDNRYYSKFARNLVYWLTESSAIGRRRLVATADKRFYRPGETITVQAATYDESAAPTKNYRVVAMVEPHTAPGETEPETSPLRWPEGLARSSGESGPFVVWGEEFELALGGQQPPLYRIQLPLSETLSSGASNQSLRLELTAYEDLTQVDSSSLDIQILHDPFEQQNPFPNHELLGELAAASGGKMLRSAEELAAVLQDVPVNVGEPVFRRSPLWSKAWVLTLLLGLLTVEWCWRRVLGLA
jgi:uncharacterized membrane protein